MVIINLLLVIDRFIECMRLLAQWVGHLLPCLLIDDGEFAPTVIIEKRHNWFGHLEENEWQTWKVRWRSQSNDWWESLSYLPEYLVARFERTLEFQMLGNRNISINKKHFSLTIIIVTIFIYELTYANIGILRLWVTVASTRQPPSGPKTAATPSQIMSVMARVDITLSPRVSFQ